MNVKLQHRVTFCEQTKTKTETGSVKTVWNDVLTVWGQLQPLKSSEQYSQQRISVNSDFKLIVRR